MSKIFKNEIIKIFSNKQIYISIGIGIILAVTLTYTAVSKRSVDEALIEMYGTKGALYYPSTVYNSFIGLDYTYVQSVILYTIFPILSTIPFAVSYYNEKKTGYVKNILVKASRKDYFIAKFGAVFFSATFTVLAISLFSLVIAMMFFPMLKPELVTSTYSVSDENKMWFGLFVNHPMIYTLAYILLDSLFYGAIALTTLVISIFVDNKFIVYSGSMILCLAVDYIAGMINVKYLSPISFLRPLQWIDGVNMGYIIVEFVILMVINGVMFLGYEKRKDVF